MNTDITTQYEKFDSCYGIITGYCKSGAFIELDNGQEAFAYDAASLPENTKIICTVKKPAVNGLRTLVNLDSVCSLYEVA